VPPQHGPSSSVPAHHQSPPRHEVPPPAHAAYEPHEAYEPPEDPEHWDLDRSARRRSRKPRGKLPTLPIPLLPIVALILAVGVVSYALSTQQISLNFAGGAPAESTREGQVSDRGTDRLAVAFRVTSKTSDAFRFTSTITNRGDRPVRSWTLAFEIPGATITGVTGATAVRTGKLPAVRSSAEAPALQPGESVKVTFAASGTPRSPSTCKMNDLPCERA
jgi:hypothetical protein